MLQVHIGELTFPVILSENEITVDQQAWPLDIVETGNRIYHLRKYNKSYQIELLEFDLNQKSVELRVNGVTVLAEIHDRYDLLLEKLGMQSENLGLNSEVVAPMPGLILEILVKEGQQVSKGDKLMVLEAMKMENILKSAGDGTIRSIRVKPGMNVEKNQVLIQF